LISNLIIIQEFVKNVQPYLVKKALRGKVAINIGPQADLVRIKMDYLGKLNVGWLGGGTIMNVNIVTLKEVGILMFIT